MCGCVDGSAEGRLCDLQLCLFSTLGRMQAELVAGTTGSRWRTLGTLALSPSPGLGHLGPTPEALSQKPMLPKAGFLLPGQLPPPAATLVIVGRLFWGFSEAQIFACEVLPKRGILESRTQFFDISPKVWIQLIYTFHCVRHGSFHAACG